MTADNIILEGYFSILSQTVRLRQKDDPTTDIAITREGSAQIAETLFKEICVGRNCPMLGYSCAGINAVNTWAEPLETGTYHTIRDKRCLIPGQEVSASLQTITKRQ